MAWNEKLGDEAADEIERLERENAELVHDLVRAMDNHSADLTADETRVVEWGEPGYAEGVERCLRPAEKTDETPAVYSVPVVPLNAADDELVNGIVQKRLSEKTVVVRDWSWTCTKCGNQWDSPTRTPCWKCDQAALETQAVKTEACQHVWQACDTGPVAVCVKCGMAD